MSEPFEPLQIQAEYFRASGFRHKLKDAHALVPDLGGEGDRARRWLRDMYQLLYHPRPTQLDPHWARRYVNAIVRLYGLGDPIE